jgi:hypothetical protein
MKEYYMKKLLLLAYIFLGCMLSIQAKKIDVVHTQDSDMIVLVVSPDGTERVIEIPPHSEQSIESEDDDTVEIWAKPEPDAEVEFIAKGDESDAQVAPIAEEQCADSLSQGKNIADAAEIEK